MLDTKTARRIVGVSVRQINHWDSTGLVSPSVRPARGTGSRRLYSFGDALLLMVVKVLRDNRVSLSRIRDVIPFVRRNLDRLEAGGGRTLLVVTDDGEVSLAADETEAAQRLASARVALVVSLSRLAEELRQRLRAGGAHPELAVRRVIVGDSAYQVHVAEDREFGGWIAECQSMPGAVARGTDPDQATERLRVVIASHVESLRSPAPAGTRQAPRPSRPGASAWGESW